MNKLEQGRKAVEDMRAEGWCDNCNANYDTCYKNGQCQGGVKDAGKEESV